MWTGVVESLMVAEMIWSLLRERESQGTRVHLDKEIKLQLRALRVYMEIWAQYEAWWLRYIVSVSTCIPISFVTISLSSEFGLGHNTSILILWTHQFFVLFTVTLSNYSSEFVWIVFFKQDALCTMISNNLHTRISHKIIWISFIL